MTTKAIGAQGVKLQRGNGAGPEVFTTIGEVYDFTGPTLTAKNIDVTSFDSAAKEFIPALVDGGTVKFDCNYVPSDTNQQGLETDMTGRVVRNFKLLLTDAVSPTVIAFAAVLTDFSIKGSTDNKIDLSCSLKITGLPTFTYAS